MNAFMQWQKSRLLCTSETRRKGSADWRDGGEDAVCWSYSGGFFSVRSAVAADETGLHLRHQEHIASALFPHWCENVHLDSNPSSLSITSVTPQFFPLELRFKIATVQQTAQTHQHSLKAESLFPALLDSSPSGCCK